MKLWEQQVIIIIKLLTLINFYLTKLVNYLENLINYFKTKAEYNPAVWLILINSLINNKLS